MKKLRLLITEKCNRNCEGCCNKDYDLENLPKIDNHFLYWDEILLTGGEPMLIPQIIRNLASKIRSVNQCPIYVYTAKVDDLQAILSTLFFVDGLTVTLHEQKDVKPFLRFNKVIPNWVRKQLRLNIFKGIKISTINLGKWKIKKNIVWLKNCPLPEDETFMRY